MQRRFFIKCVTALPTLTQPLTVFAEMGREPIEISKLKKLIDLLIPADETPSASELNVHMSLMSSLRHRNLSKKALTLLDELSSKTLKKPFEELTTNQSIQTIQALFDHPQNGRLFSYFYDTCLEIYYSDSRSWAASSITQPPQPHGYII